MSDIKIERLPLGFIGANCYFVTVNGETSVIDPGLNSPKLLSMFEKYKGQVKYILLTHRHADHLMGLKMAKDITNAEVAIHSADKEGCHDSNFSLSKQIFRCEIEPVYPDIILNDGDKLALGTLEISVISTPGHTTGSVCFIIGDNIFSGDTVFYEQIGRCDFESGDYRQMLTSLKKLDNLEGDYNIYPGHGERTTLQHEREHNPYFEKAAEI